jgi:cytochrome P450
MPPALARIIPPEQPLPPVRLIRTIVRNPIEAWPKPVYEQPVFRSLAFGRETVFITEPDLIQEVLVTQADAFRKAESLRRALRPALGDAILTAEGSRWRWQRRATAPIFRHERIRSFVPMMIEAAERTRDKWLAQHPGAEINVAHEMMRTTFDIIVQTMLSGAGSIEVGRVEQGIRTYLDSTSWAIAFGLLGLPQWTPYPGKGKAGRARDYLRSELLRLAAQRRGAEAERDDLISLLLQASDPETGQAMDDREVADNLLTFITAGHETTALALTWTFYLLSLHPEIEERVVDEVETVTAGAAFSENHVDRLGFISQVLQEAMRLYPPAPVVVRAANYDVSIAGVSIAKDSAVYIPLYAVHRRRGLWEAPEEFRPERFAAEPSRARHRYAYLPFGAGPRICIGMSFAMIEATVVMAVLIRTVRLRLRPGFLPTLKLRVTLRPSTGMPMTVQRR